MRCPYYTDCTIEICRRGNSDYPFYIWWFHRQSPQPLVVQPTKKGRTLLRSVPSGCTSSENATAPAAPILQLNGIACYSNPRRVVEPVFLPRDGEDSLLRLVSCAPGSGAFGVGTVNPRVSRLYYILRTYASTVRVFYQTNRAVCGRRREILSLDILSCPGCLPALHQLADRGDNSCRRSGL